MERIRVIFMTVVACAVLLFFIVGIVLAAWYTLRVQRPDDMPKIVSYFVAVVNGPLAANLGALLGIGISLRGWRGPGGAMEMLQWVAAIVYVGGLVLAGVFWGMAGFTEEASKVVSILPEMTRNGIGILVAILAAVLGVQIAAARAGVIAERDR